MSRASVLAFDKVEIRRIDRGVAHRHTNVMRTKRWLRVGR